MVSDRRLPDRYGNDFGGGASLLEAYRFLDADLVKRVHRHFDIGGFDA